VGEEEEAVDQQPVRLLHFGIRISEFGNGLRALEDKGVEKVAIGHGLGPPPL